MIVVDKNRKPQSWKRWFHVLGKIDFCQLLPMICLLSIGTLFIYGAGQHLGGARFEGLWKLQLRWISLGFIAWLIFSLIDYHIVGRWSWLFYLIGNIALVAVLFIGIETKGASRWIDLGIIRFQPSEFAKFAVLLLCSWLLSLRNFDINRFSHLTAIIAVAGIPFILIILEPDLGSAMVLIPLASVLLFVSKLKWKYIIIGLAVAVLAIPSVYPFLKPYQQERIKVFINPGSNIRKSGWHQYQAELAVGSGGMYGKGYRKGTQSALGFLPETHTDFIFSVIAEETGFVGAITTIGLYIVLLFSILRTAFLTDDQFAKNLAVGTATIIFTHSVVNLGMSIRLMPVTGLPLPLVSYGGSFIISTMIYLGILQSIYSRTKEPIETGKPISSRSSSTI